MSFFELLSWGLWDATRKRKLIGAAVICSVPVFLAIIPHFAHAGFNPSVAYDTVFPLAVQQFAMVLLCILYGTNAVAAEVSGKTIPFLLTRPTSRVSIFLSKWAAGTVFSSAATIICALLVALVIYGPSGIVGSPILRDALVIPVGVAVYMAVFCCLSTLLTRPSVPAIAYVFAFETWVWVVPGDFIKLSIMTYVRTISLHSPPVEQNGLAELVQQMRNSTVSMTTSWNTLAVILILALAIGCFAFSRGEYVPKEDTT